MGVEHSREICMDSRVNDKKFRKRKIEGWTSQDHTEYSSRTTLRREKFLKAGKIINSYLSSEKYHRKMNILEVGSGNRAATKIVTDCFKDHILGIITTDIAPHPTDYPEIRFDNVHSVGAVSKYGNWANTLLLISPLPGEIDSPASLSDYYACHDFIESGRKGKMIIFIGELGASDGTSGMYRYLMDHNRLELKKRDIVSKSVDCFGGPTEKEVFIFCIV